MIDCSLEEVMSGIFTSHGYIILAIIACLGYGISNPIMTTFYNGGGSPIGIMYAYAIGMIGMALIWQYFFGGKMTIGTNGNWIIWLSLLILLSVSFIAISLAFGHAAKLGGNALITSSVIMATFPAVTAIIVMTQSGNFEIKKIFGVLLAIIGAILVS